MKWPHRLVIERAGEGTQDEDTGVWTPTDALPVYYGGADVQDRGATVERNAEGLPVRRSDGVAFLENEAFISEIQEGDHAVVFWEDGTEQSVEVVEVRRLDGRLALNFL